MVEAKIFKPFKVIELNDSCLHLQESKRRRIFLFIFFRIYTILLALTIIAVALIFEIPIYYQISLFLIAVFLLSASQKKYITELKLQKDKAYVVFKTFGGEKYITVSLYEIEKITIESYYFANGAGYQFRLAPKGGKKQIPILTIPDYFRNVKNKSDIKDFLEKLTGLAVVKF